MCTTGALIPRNDALPECPGNVKNPTGFIRGSRSEERWNMVDKVDSLTVENIILIPVVLFVIWLGFSASIALMFWYSYVLLRAAWGY